MAHAAWADAEEYVSRHRGSRENKWLALYRDGERTVGVICVIIDADGHPVEERERVTLRCTPLYISTYCKDARLACRAQLVADYPFLETSKRRAHKQAQADPGCPVVYEGGHGYWSSVLLQLERCVERAHTGVDPLEGKPKRKVGAAPESPEACPCG